MSAFLDGFLILSHLKSDWMVPSCVFSDWFWERRSVFADSRSATRVSQHGAEVLYPSQLTWINLAVLIW